MTFAVVARYVCPPEDADDVRDALLAMREHTRQEPANLAYVVHEEVAEVSEVVENPAFLLYEQYTDRDGFDAHTRTTHFTEHILGHVRPRLVERTVHFVEVL